MSTQQQRTELLAFGYVHQTYAGTVPYALKKLMQICYDKHTYWILRGEKLKEFTNAEHEKEMCSKSFTIKGIQFQIVACPNGLQNEFHGIVCVGIRIVYFPPNVESANFYLEMKCETLNKTVKGLWIVTEVGHLGGPDMDPLCALSELKNRQSVSFNCFINIQCIKYKKECNKINYYSPINKIQKYSKFEWNIDGALMQKCKNMIVSEPVYSDSFDNNNWCLKLFPNGESATYKGGTDIFLRGLSLPHTINSMEIKFSFVTDTNERIEFPHNYTLHANDNALKIEYGDRIMPFADFKAKDSLTFTVTLEILNIYDNNDQIIAEEEWGKYGCIINTN